MSDNEDSVRLHSGAYVENYEHHPLSRLERLAPRLHLTGHEELLDVACGNAMLLPLVHDRVRHYTGVDFSKDFIDAATRRAAAAGIQNCSFHCENVVSFCNERPNTFDVATALDFSEHIHDADFIEIFSAVRASLKPGGRLYLHTPNLDFVVELLKHHGILKQFPEHIAVRNGQHLCRLLEESGFPSKNIRLHHIAHYYRSMRLVHSLRHLPLVGRHFVARLFVECTR